MKSEPDNNGAKNINAGAVLGDSGTLLHLAVWARVTDNRFIFNS
ncbi:MAG TPA: hypothetical protein PKY29_02165 [Ferruginibacter sp.]|nr:hypothetical protein [Ferruginibacter sp.]HRO16803.1 hypothetical protein [Ferruginibacter sp.]HRQ20086.1 hypothetical protein [Ferruginibacter sp.]